MSIYEKLESEYWQNAGLFMQKKLKPDQYAEICGINFGEASAVLGTHGVEKYLFVLCMRFALQNIIEKNRNKKR